MKTIPIKFFKEEIKFRLADTDNLKYWILKIIKNKKYKLSELNFIFCGDKFLRKINKKYLNHDYYTDIITFDNSITKEFISGDIFISIDRVRINANTYKSSFNDELHRVIAHGVLHLLGYGDKSKDQKIEMKKMEDRCLMKRDF